MSNADQIRDDIERTRAELGDDVDALADKVRPSSIAHRQVGKVRGAFDNVKEKVMGSASSVGDSASSVGGKVSDASQTAVRKAEGNPVAVGLIAFGAGLLISSLIPASDKERTLAQGVKEQAQPLVDDLGQAAKEAGQNLKEPAREAADAVKTSATDAAQNVRGEATDAASQVKDSASQG